MSAPRVSVLINNYNYGRYLRQAIDSALNQSYLNKEVVVVDDGSVDDSREVMGSYGAQIISVFKANGGQASAFNAGFAAASGDIICFLDADDYYTPQAIEKIVAVWRPETKILHHRLLEVDQRGDPIGYYPALNRELDFGNVLPRLLAAGTYNAPTTSGLVYSRTLLESVLPMPEAEYRLCADTYLFLVTPFLASVSILDETLACYRFHDGNAYRDATSRYRKRTKLEMAQHYRDLRRDLLIQLAMEHGFPAPDIAPWEQASHRFDRLLLARSSPTSVQKETRGLALLLFRQIWETGWPFLIGRLRMSILTLMVTFAPRALLAKIYPNIFSRE